MTDEARAADSPPRPAVHIPNPTYLYVIFDGPPSHESGRFVEVEDENGQGVSAGNWEERGDGFWTLGPFLQPPAEVAEQPATDLGAMVEAILRECDLPLFVCQTEQAARYQATGILARIHDTADRLKVALKEREGVMGVMGEMEKALESRAVAAHGHLEEAGVRHEHPFRECEHPACLDVRALVDQCRAVRRSAPEVIEPLELVAEAKLHCPCGLAYGPSKPGEVAERVTIPIGNDYSGECVACHRTFRLVCRVEASEVEGE